MRLHNLKDVGQILVLGMVISVAYSLLVGVSAQDENTVTVSGHLQDDQGLNVQAQVKVFGRNDDGSIRSLGSTSTTVDSGDYSLTFSPDTRTEAFVGVNYSTLAGHFRVKYFEFTAGDTITDVDFVVPTFDFDNKSLKLKITLDSTEIDYGDDPWTAILHPAGKADGSAAQMNWATDPTLDHTFRDLVPGIYVLEVNMVVGTDDLDTAQLASTVTQVTVTNELSTATIDLESPE